MRKLKDEASKAKSKQDKAEQRALDLESKLEKKDQQINELKDQQGESKGTIREMKEKMTRFESETRSMRSQVESFEKLKTKHAGCSDTIDELRAVITEYKRAQEKLQNRLLKKAIKIQRLTGKEHDSSSSEGEHK